MIGWCKLCNQEKSLKKSHSIPRTFFLGIKEKGKCILVQNGISTLKGNFDPKEFMLCGDCEGFLSREYEAYGTRVLKGYKNVNKYDDYIIFLKFKYDKFYLYLISVLWRASIAKDEHYSEISLGHDIEEILRSCMLMKKTNISDSNSFKLDHFIRISVYRITDSTKNLSDEIIKSILSNICLYREASSEGLVYYWICDGFIIFYFLYVGKDFHSARALRLQSQLVKGSHQKIFKLEITKNALLKTIFNRLISSSKSGN